MCRSDGTRFDCYGQKDGLTSGLVWTLAFDREGNLWAGTIGGGLHRFRAGPFMTFTEADGLSGPIILPVYQDRAGAIWAGTAGAGLNRLADGRVDVFTTRNGLPHNVVLALTGAFVLAFHEDESRAMWIGTADRGLVRVKDGRVVAIQKKDGLFDTTAGWILDDGRGDFWLTSNKGVYRVAVQQLNAFADGRARSLSVSSYGTADGMKSAECNGGFQPAGWTSTDGRLWFPTTRGLSVVDPARLSTSNPAPAEAGSSVA